MPQNTTTVTVEPLFNTTTTLNEIRAAGPCQDGWRKLLVPLNKTKADDEPLELITLLNSNDLDDALWCLRVPSLERLSRHFQAWCAEQVLHEFEAERPEDMRVRDQIAMLRNDTATEQERAAARSAARDSVWDAAGSAVWAAVLPAARNFEETDLWDTAGISQEEQLRKMIGGAEC